MNQQHSNETSLTESVEKLIEACRQEDAYNSAGSKTMKWVYSLFGGIALLATWVVSLESCDCTYDRAIAYSFLFGIGYFLGYLFWEQRKKANFSYDVAAAKLLPLIIQRFDIRSSQIVALIPPLLSIGAALSLVVNNPKGDDLNWVNFWLVFGLFLLVIFIFAYVGYRIWKTRQEPLVVEARRILREVDVA
ncbi:hypothetical protein [Mongoliitalea lutea]|uniref:Uncharacterized protein n=1 Tax=Mongoliitalea lutea TaxID=849756 RepID=A0A8J3G513_9BACT|nr:hypothetical protein [Mongoliitalea lutea]GHB33863.1 hypothetical protein GCM10008106_13650 [Mongoliitalea lutea]